VPFRWTETGGFEQLDDVVTDISADGSVIVGNTRHNDLPRGYRWTESGGFDILDPLAGHDVTRVSGISADGSVIVGISGDTQAEPGAGAAPARWTQNGGVEAIGLPPGSSFGWAMGANADGTVIVGHSGSETAGPEIFRWTEPGGIQELGKLPGDLDGFAVDTSADGSVVVGWGDTNLPSPFHARTFIWDASHGMRDLRDVLTEAGLDFSGWSLNFPRGISDDGTKIVGQGYNPAGLRESWLVDLSTNTPGDTNGDGVVDADDLNNVRDFFGTMGASDGTLDGDAYPFDCLVNIDDLNAVRNHFGAMAAPVPEPGAGGLLIFGAMAFLLTRRRADQNRRMMEETPCKGGAKTRRLNVP